MMVQEGSKTTLDRPTPFLGVGAALLGGILDETSPVGASTASGTGPRACENQTAPECHFGALLPVLHGEIVNK